MKLLISVDQAVERLTSELSLTEKTMIVNTSEEELIDLQFTLGEYIRKEFRLDENDDLMESCRFVSKVDEITPTETEDIGEEGVVPLEELGRVEPRAVDDETVRASMDLLRGGEYGDAELVAEMFGTVNRSPARLVYVETTKTWYMWDGDLWVQRSDQFVARLLPHCCGRL